MPWAGNGAQCRQNQEYSVEGEGSDALYTFRLDSYHSAGMDYLILSAAEYQAIQAISARKRRAGHLSTISLSNRRRRCRIPATPTTTTKRRVLPAPRSSTTRTATSFPSIGRIWRNISTTITIPSVSKARTASRERTAIPIITSMPAPCPETTTSAASITTNITSSIIRIG